MCSVNFWHQQDYNSLFKGSIGHVTSWCKRPIIEQFAVECLKTKTKPITHQLDYSAFSQSQAVVKPKNQSIINWLLSTLKLLLSLYIMIMIIMIMIMIIVIIIRLL